MKNIIAYVITGALAISTLSCTTTYDAYGNPRQSVDPGTAAAGVAAAGVLGYALARDKNKSNNHYDRHDYHRGHGHYNRYDRYGRYHRY